jgi:hypothetical protein
MAAERDLRSLLNDPRTVAALDRQFRRSVDRIIREMAAGVSRPGSKRATELLRSLNDQINRLDPRKSSFVRRWIRRNIPRAFVLGDRAGSRQLRDELRKITSEKRQDFGKVNRSFTGANQTSLRGIVASMENTMGRVADQMRTNLGLVVRRTQQVLVSDASIRDVTVGGIIRGATGKQIKDDIASVILGKKVKPQVRARLQAQGFRAEHFRDFEQVARGQIIEVGKKRLNVRDYANLVGRTQPREAHKAATIVRLQQNKVDYVRISRHKQAEPDECTPFAGKVFYIGPLAKDPKGFRKLSSIPNGGPPFHPNCIHVLEPFVVSFKTKETIDKALASTKALPRNVFGKTGSEVRKIVAGLSDQDLQKIAAEGFEDIAA